MTAYQAGIAQFEQNGAVVLGISTDNLPSLGYWAKEVLKVGFPLASDFQRTVTATYGVLNKERGFANRTTFVIDGAGVIQHVEEGNSAVDVTGAATACSRLKKH
jgi:peroxiredoxin